MRYIGNKTRLLPFLTGILRRLGLPPGTAHDAFAGTAVVGRTLKAAGWRVASSDLMTYSYVFQRAYVVASRRPSAARLAAADPLVRRALQSPALRARANGHGSLGLLAAYLTHALAPEAGFVTRHFSPAGERMYFTEQNAGRIDAARGALHRWRTEGAVDDDTYYLLLAALLEGADRVANTAGVYAAFIKQWQPNAHRPLALAPELPLRGRGSTAHLGDAAEAAAALGPVDLLYVDPPYNGRQYAGYYHVPEVIARGWFDGEPTLRGKTGLLGAAAPRSDWCVSRRARRALEGLLAATGARHVLVSYNSEGLLPDAVMREVLGAAAADGRVRRFVKAYRRYRADRDHERRRYRGDEVRELLYYARLR
ncbi:MAG TPA: DNA adenine methylase [Gemmatimonadaceae bacterium]|nr:DNA adenine methylase [Gemmatimonadaceae bacterium]